MRVIQRPLEDHGGAAGHERRVHHVAVADDPADIGRRPPHVGRLETEAPAAHADHVDLVAAVCVDRELRFRRRAGGGKNERRLVGFHRHMVAALAGRPGEKRLPRHVAIGMHRRRVAGPLLNDHALDRIAGRPERLVDDFFETDVLSFPVGGVGREDQPRAACLHAVGERLCAEPGEHDRMNGADADGGEHQHDGFRSRRHVDRETVALADAEPAQCRSDTLDAIQQLRVGEHRAVPAFVDVDERSMPAPPARDVTIEGVVGKVGPGADEPAERGICPLEHAVPGSKPGQFPGGALPECFGIVETFTNPAVDEGSDEAHRLFPQSTIMANSRVAELATR